MSVELGRLDEFEPGGEGLEDHGPVQGLLGGEVVQQAGAADPDVVGDVVQAGAVVALRGEALERDGQNLRLGVVAGHRRPLTDHRV